jgi:apolipoprotein N-acyltransferase
MNQNILFVLLWLSIDYAMLYTEIGFPLLSISHHVAFYPSLIQFAKYFGSLGVNLFLLVLNIFLISLLDLKSSKRTVFRVSLIIILFQSLNLISSNQYPADKSAENVKVLALNTNLECPEEKYSKSANDLLHIYTH